MRNDEVVGIQIIDYCTSSGNGPVRSFGVVYPLNFPSQSTESSLALVLVTTCLHQKGGSFVCSIIYMYRSCKLYLPFRHCESFQPSVDDFLTFQPDIVDCLGGEFEFVAVNPGRVLLISLECHGRKSILWPLLLSLTSCSWF